MLEMDDQDNVLKAALNRKTRKARPRSPHMADHQQDRRDSHNALIPSDISGILAAIVTGHKQSDIEALLPWNFKG